KTLEREATVSAPEGGINVLAIGADATSPLILLAPRGAKKSYLIDSVTMNATPLTWNGWNGEIPERVHFSFDGLTAVACGGGWAGIEVINFVDGKPVSHRHGSSVRGDTQISGNGELVFPHEGGVLRQDLVSVVKGVVGTPFPAYDPEYS